YGSECLLIWRRRGLTNKVYGQWLIGVFDIVDLVTIATYGWRLCFDNRIAIDIPYLLDQERLDLIPTISKYSIASGNFHGRDALAAKGQGKVMWQCVLVKAEAVHPVYCFVDTDLAQYPD